MITVHDVTGLAVMHERTVLRQLLNTDEDLAADAALRLRPDVLVAMHSRHVLQHVLARGEALVTGGTGVRCLACVRPHMLMQLPLHHERPAAKSTRKAPLQVLRANVLPQRVVARKLQVAHVTAVALDVHVRVEMLAKVLLVLEALVAQRARKRLRVVVRDHVTRQVHVANKSAAAHLAFERPLPAVVDHVMLKLRLAANKRTQRALKRQITSVDAVSPQMAQHALFIVGRDSEATVVARVLAARRTTRHVLVKQPLARLTTQLMRA